MHIISCCIYLSTKYPNTYCNIICEWHVHDMCSAWHVHPCIHPTVHGPIQHQTLGSLLIMGPARLPPWQHGPFAITIWPGRWPALNQVPQVGHKGCFYCWMEASLHCDTVASHGLQFASLTARITMSFLQLALWTITQQTILKHMKIHGVVLYVPWKAIHQTMGFPIFHQNYPLLLVLARF